MNTTSIGKVAIIDCKLILSFPITIIIRREVPKPTKPIMNPPNNPTFIITKKAFRLYLKSTR